MPKTDASFDPRRYAPVALRITRFYERWPEGRINTELVSREGGELVFRAFVYRTSADAHPAATGWASERLGDGDINSVACLENTETSAIGRALANLGFTASRERPSREEMEKSERVRRRQVLATETGLSSQDLEARANAAHDLLDLIARAETGGLPPRRSAFLRQRVGRAPGLALPRVRKLESLLRARVQRDEWRAV